MTEIRFPARIDGRFLFPFLARLSEPIPGGAVRLDVSGLRRVAPAGLVALVAIVLDWRRRGYSIEFGGWHLCPLGGYLQRMEAFRMAGFDVPEIFERHEAKGRFLPVRLVDHRTAELGSQMAAGLAPGGESFDHPFAGLYDLCYYTLTELANNVRQHSAGLGFASAQVDRSNGLVRLALADHGMGFRGSLHAAGVPLIDQLSDAAVIRMALEPRISCKSSETNEGVGLTLIGELAQLTKACLLIVSGRGVVRISGGEEPVLEEMPSDGIFPGTLIAMTFPQAAARNFPQLLQSAQMRAGLLRTRRANGRFQP